jgi:hypothetical protein
MAATTPIVTPGPRDIMEKEACPPLPPRYRFRDLIMGDYAFNDDGERSVSPSAQLVFGVFRVAANDDFIQ